jgi:probable H4MPT-linked C1 transfer pathway protein
MPRDAIGLDIGGANLKAATASGEALSVPFELWRHPERLAAELARIRDRWPDIADVAVTMTGELCDCFQTKRDGVRHILAAVEEAFPQRTVRVWSTGGRFLSVEEANRDHLGVAAANWHALATIAGRESLSGFGLLVDTGSTTTDIIPIRDGIPVPGGLTDPDRLRFGELVYTGFRRTPVCAVLGAEVAAEWFATTHDVYVRLGFAPEEPENRSTADGRPMTRQYAHGRLSRMLCGDPETTTQEETAELGWRVFARQRRIIGDGVRRVIAQIGERPRVAVLSGSGDFLALAALCDLCEAGDIGKIPVSYPSTGPGRPLLESACAVAVATLAAETRP